jgi:DNA-directed RNA polymerase subunit RPC12/RpoP
MEDAMNQTKMLKALAGETETASESAPATNSDADPALSSYQHIRYITEHTTCAMCDSELEIRHEINRPELKVKEEAHCPDCGIRVRSKHHLMH